MAAKRSPARKKKTTKKPTVNKTLKGQENVKFVLRIHPKIHAKIKSEAAKSFQSMNEYIHGKMADAVDPKNTLSYLIKELKKNGVI